MQGLKYADTTGCKTDLLQGHWNR